MNDMYGLETPTVPINLKQILEVCNSMLRFPQTRAPGGTIFKSLRKDHSLTFELFMAKMIGSRIQYRANSRHN